MIHPNVFGMFVATVLPLVIAVFLVRTGRFRPLFLVALALGMPALIVTYSRSSWLAMALNSIALLTLMVFHQGLRRRSLMAGAAAAFVLGAVCILFLGPITKRVLDSKAGAMLARAQFEENAYQMIEARRGLAGVSIAMRMPYCPIRASPRDIAAGSRSRTTDTSFGRPRPDLSAWRFMSC